MLLLVDEGHYKALSYTLAKRLSLAMTCIDGLEAYLEDCATYADYTDLDEIQQNIAAFRAAFKEVK